LRDGSEVQVGGHSVGTLTSGNYSPMRGCGVGLALIDADAALLDGDAVTVVQRGRQLGANLVRPPLWPIREEDI
jgi:aminomethyltransferase